MADEKKSKNTGTSETDPIVLRRKRIIAIISVIITVALFLLLAYYVTEAFFAAGNGNIGEAAKYFSERIKSFGAAGVLVAFGIQVLQVVVSPIPGEVIEIGMGLCFGGFWGTVICLLGAALGAWIILVFVRKYGYKIVELFVSTEKINELRFINSERKLSNSVFILYIIPGTPKDPLIFFFGLTKIKISDFIIISTLARIPSVASSTVGGQLVVDEKYSAAIILFAVTAAISIAGMVIYRVILKKSKERKQHKI